MSGCLGFLHTDIEVAADDRTYDMQYFLSRGLTHYHIKNARLAWTCLIEGMCDTDLVDRVYAHQCTPISERRLEIYSCLISAEINCYPG